MALGDVIARLAVNLSLETAAFEKGATKSEKRLNQMRRKFDDFGKAVKVGALAVGSAVVGLNKVFGDLADKAKEMGIAAQVAGEGFEDFQRGAFAAKSVGIEFDKFGDILKDVRDRIGDFAQTGGGPMADFFENIAPKVGVTAKQFEGLGGKQALQLYYDSLKKANVSQEDMVFYLEAMASDATQLIPLLENSGKAFDELGGKAAIITDEQRDQLEKYNQAMLQMENGLQRLTLALVDSGLLETFVDMAEKLAAVAEGFTGVEAAANATEEQLKKTEGARTFGQNMKTANDAVQKFFDDFDAMNARNAERSRAFWRGVGQAITDTTDFLDSLVIRSHQALQRMYQGVKLWLQDKIGAIFDWVNEKIKTVENGFAWLYDRVVGNSWIPDMVAEVGQHMSKLQTLMVDPATRAAQRTDEAFRNLASNVSGILDRLFPEAARLRQMYDDIATIDAAQQAGILSEGVANEAVRRTRAETRGTGRAEPREVTTSSPVGVDIDATVSKMEIFKSGVKALGDTTKDQTVRIAESFKDMAQKTMAAFSSLVGAIKGGGFLDILEAGVNLFLNLAGSGVFGKGLAGKINGYATGTTSAARGLALVGERGPELVNFRGGERVYNDADTRAMMGGRGRPYFDLRGAVMTADLIEQMNRIGDVSAERGALGGAKLADSRARYAATRRVSR